MDAPCLCRKVTVGRLAFHKARSAVPYESPFRELILQFKFQGSYRVRPFLCETFLEGYRRFYQVESFEAIVPVPLHWFRRFQREFNQAEVLGEALAAELGIPLISRALHRTRRTLPQSSLAGRWRIDNLKGAFSLGSDFHPGMKLLLVDDVMTTGMTLNACAEVLRLGGATEVHAFTLARRM
jgi:ComF family protein